jgi:hypothetical protein
MSVPIYEKPENREIERQLGEKFRESIETPITLIQQPELSTYDFRSIRNADNLFFAWLEVKQKCGDWLDHPEEMIPLPKWEFAEHTGVPCYFLVERSGVARLFNISKFIREGIGRRGTFTRHDRPDETMPVIYFDSNLSRTVWNES